MRPITMMFVGTAPFAGVAAFPAYAVPLTGQSGAIHNQIVEQGGPVRSSCSLCSWSSQ
jgi:hypothetical protein